jgi:hypothetical protein
VSSDALLGLHGAFGGGAGPCGGAACRRRSSRWACRSGTPASNGLWLIRRRVRAATGPARAFPDGPHQFHPRRRACDARRISSCRCRIRCRPLGRDPWPLTGFGSRNCCPQHQVDLQFDSPSGESLVSWCPATTPAAVPDRRYRPTVGSWQRSRQHHWAKRHRRALPLRPRHTHRRADRLPRQHGRPLTLVLLQSPCWRNT